MDNALGIVEKHLAQRRFLVGDGPTIADFSLCGYLFYPVKESGIDIAEQYPHMAAWLQRMCATTGWKGPYRLLPGAVIAPRW